MPIQPVWHHAHTQLGDPILAVPGVLDQNLVLQPFERTLVMAKVVTPDVEPLVFQNVVLNAAIADASLQNVVFSEDCVAAAGGTGHVFVSVTNLTSNPHSVRGGTHLGAVVPVSLVYRAVPHQLADTNPKTEVNKDRVDFVCKVYETMNLWTE